MKINKLFDKVDELIESAIKEGQGKGNWGHNKKRYTKEWTGNSAKERAISYLDSIFGIEY